MKRQQDYKKTRYGYGARSKARTTSALQTFRKKSVRPGYTRTAGYYGRYNTRASNELKFFDTSINTSIDSTGEVLAGGQINLVPQGTTESTRIGRKINIRAVDIKGYVAGNGITTTAEIMQICLILDKQCNGAAAGYTDVFTTNDINSFRNMAYSERFQVLKTWRMAINPMVPIIAGTSFLPPYRNFTYHKNCSIPVEFSSTTGAITEIKTNNLFIVGIASGGDDTANLTAIVRIKYSD